MLFFSFFFTKLDQMSRVGSRGRHLKCRPKNPVVLFQVPLLRSHLSYLQNLQFLNL